MLWELKKLQVPEPKIVAAALAGGADYEILKLIHEGRAVAKDIDFGKSREILILNSNGDCVMTIYKGHAFIPFDIWKSLRNYDDQSYFSFRHFLTKTIKELLGELLGIPEALKVSVVMATGNVRKICLT